MKLREGRSFRRLAAAVFLVAACTAVAQDGPSVEVYSDSGGGENTSVSRWRLPVVVSVSLSGGYDENASTAATGDGSIFTSGSINLAYSFGTERTRGNLSASTGMTYYPELSGDQYDPNISLNLGITHQVSLRMMVSVNISAHYQAEPDFSTDLSLDRRAGNYFNTDDSFAVSYQWLPRISTVTSYSLATVQFEDDFVGVSQDRIDHSFSQSLRFLYLPVTTIVGEYRLALTTYDSFDRDSHTQSFLVGVDHTVSEKLHGSIRIGADYRTTDSEAFSGDDGFNPHVEVSLNYALTGKASLAWNASYATQEAYLADAASSVTFRTGLQATYAITPRLSSNVSAYYQHNDNEGVELFPGFSFSFVEDSIDLSVGLNYSINRHLSAYAGYSHTEVESDFTFRSYSRNRYSGGLNITF